VRHSRFARMSFLDNRPSWLLYNSKREHCGTVKRQFLDEVRIAGFGMRRSEDNKAGWSVRIPTKSPGHSEMMSPGVPT
jgi:hypothetical protein